MLPIESPTAPKSLDSSRKKVCKHYRLGHCQLEKGCIFFHPQEQSKSSIKAPDTSNGLSCCPDSPLERPNGEEDDNKSLEAHTHEIEGDINDNAFHDDSPDRMDQAPYSDGEFNGNQPDPPQPRYDDEAYKEQPDNGPSNLSHRTDSVDRDVEETYANPVEPFNKCFKPFREERSPAPPATQLQARQPVGLPVVPPPPKYPHVSEIIPHWTQFADPHASKDVPFCKQLAQRGCSQGDRCRFRHSITVEEYTLLFNDQQPNLWTLRRDGVNEATVSSPTPQPQVDSPHISSAVAVKSSIFGPCKFHPIGKCHNGKSCPFDHTQQPMDPVPTVSNADQERQTSERPKKSQRPCYFHFERGYCHRGLSCKFGHGNVEGNHPSSGTSGPESAPSLIDDDEGGRENQVNNNNFDPDTHAEDNGWGGADWDRPSHTEDHRAWDIPSGNDYNHQELSNKPLNSVPPKTENGGWPPTDDSCHSVPWNTLSRRLSHDPEDKPQEGRSQESCKAENPNEPGEVFQDKIQSTWNMGMEPITLSENEPKAQEGDSQDSQILDNEATWSQSQVWHTEATQPPRFPIKINAPCKRFGQGFCPYKDDCNYLHIQVIEDSDIVEHTSNSEGDFSVSISLK